MKVEGASGITPRHRPSESQATSGPLPGGTRAPRGLCGAMQLQPKSPQLPQRAAFSPRRVSPRPAGAGCGSWRRRPPSSPAGREAPEAMRPASSAHRVAFPSPGHRPALAIAEPDRVVRRVPSHVLVPLFHDAPEEIWAACRRSSSLLELPVARGSICSGSAATAGLLDTPRERSGRADVDPALCLMHPRTAHSAADDLCSQRPDQRAGA